MFLSGVSIINDILSNIVNKFVTSLSARNYVIVTLCQLCVRVSVEGGMQFCRVLILGMNGTCNAQSLIKHEVRKLALACPLWISGGTFMHQANSFVTVCFFPCFFHQNLIPLKFHRL